MGKSPLMELSREGIVGFGSGVAGSRVSWGPLQTCLDSLCFHLFGVSLAPVRLSSGGRQMSQSSSKSQPLQEGEILLPTCSNTFSRPSCVGMAVTPFHSNSLRVGTFDDLLYTQHQEWCLTRKSKYDKECPRDE